LFALLIYLFVHLVHRPDISPSGVVIFHGERSVPALSCSADWRQRLPSSSASTSVAERLFLQLSTLYAHCRLHACSYAL